MLVVGADAHERLSDPDAGDGAEGLAEGAAHPSLQTIRACARQHLVDPEHVVGVHADTDVELVLGRVLHHVLKRDGERDVNIFFFATINKQKCKISVSKKLEYFAITVVLMQVFYHHFK
jgi:hypothetical protein